MKIGLVVIVVIISCMNIFNLYVMLSVGLVVKKVVEKGLEVLKFVKIFLVLGFKVVIGYLEKVGLFLYLEKFGFDFVGYGCMMCIGNFGLLKEEIEEVI